MIPRLAKKLVPMYKYRSVIRCDQPPNDIIKNREKGLKRITHTLLPVDNWPSVADVSFAANCRVPFQFREFANEHFPYQPWLHPGSDQKKIDAFSSLGVDIFGTKMISDCLTYAAQQIECEGFSLGKYHPELKNCIKKLQEISGHPYFTFHNSGTEGVLAACRMAKFATGKERIAKFRFSYHGWIEIHGIKTVKNLSQLKRQKNLAAVLINPLCQLYQSGTSKSDATLFANATGERFCKKKYSLFLRDLRHYCQKMNVLLIFDETFLGFRLAYGGCQEYFGIKADMTIYGKSVGGGVPIGVVCGPSKVMKKFDHSFPLNFLAGKGTFAGNPLAIIAMSQFLLKINPIMYVGVEERWQKRVQSLNQRLKNFPIDIDHIQSVMTVHYHTPSRYNWMFQFYLESFGLASGPYGTGRLIFPINLSDQRWEAIQIAIIDAATCFNQDGWWWTPEKINKRHIILKIINEMIRYRVSHLLQIT